MPVDMPVQEIMEDLDNLFIKPAANASQDPDIIALQETRLRPCHNLNLPNYKTYRTDRLTHRGGGTAVLIKSSIPHHVLDIKTHSLENTTIAIEGERNITISSIYRPPRSPAPSLISDLLRIFRNRSECLAVGDTMRYIEHGTTMTDPIRRGMPSTDLQGTAALPSQPRQTPRGFRIEETAETAHSTSEFLVQLRFHGKPAKDHRENRLRKLWQTTRYPPVKAELNKLQREIKRELKGINEHVWDCDLEEANYNIDTLFKIINRKKQKQIIYPPLLGYRGLVYDTRGKANLFADTLEESFKENKKPYSNIQIAKVNRAVRNYLREAPHSLPPLTSPSEVCEVIYNLKIKKPGKDNVKNIALKSLPINAITYLTKKSSINAFSTTIFRKLGSMPSLQFSQSLEKNHKLPINYRPISLLSTIGKVLKIILTRIKNFTITNEIIPKFQHGFQEKTSTSLQLLRVSNLIIEGFNSGKTTGGVFLDVEKAFDRMWHRGLIFKMIHLKFPDYIINLTHSFLANRTFQVRIEATTSRIAHIEAGSPQGSNLSPILYNIYTYDFPTSPLVEVCLFADDAAIISQASNPVNVRTRLQTYLYRLKNWLRLWRISINTEKSKAIIFKKGQYRRKPSIEALSKPDILEQPS
ncbi:RNA-directed DNA polymerase from mobile element jockey [Trichonephila clavipes]|nr:RNA-directed DNA polymerase from mobile element jockey [Trichonephila clavipes]